MGTRRISVTVYNVPVGLTGHVLTSFLRAPERLKGDGFHAILNGIHFSRRRLMVVVEGRKPYCWHCKQFEHLAKSYPQRVEWKPKEQVVVT